MFRSALGNLHHRMKEVARLKKDLGKWGVSQPATRDRIVLELVAMEKKLMGKGTGAESIFRCILKTRDPSTCCFADDATCLDVARTGFEALRKIWVTILEDQDRDAKKTQRIYDNLIWLLTTSPSRNNMWRLLKVAAAVGITGLVSAGAYHVREASALTEAAEKERDAALRDKATTEARAQKDNADIKRLEKENDLLFAWNKKFNDAKNSAELKLFEEKLSHGSTKRNAEKSYEQEVKATREMDRRRILADQARAAQEQARKELRDVRGHANKEARQFQRFVQGKIGDDDVEDMSQAQATKILADLKRRASTYSYPLSSIIQL
jgi:hypothetical protein